jgi:two-component system, sporulation sensor kinase C
MARRTPPRDGTESSGPHRAGLSRGECLRRSRRRFEFRQKHSLMTTPSDRSKPRRKPSKPAPVAAPAVDDRWFRAVADYTYDWESWHSPEGRLIWVNQAVERTTGYSVGECFGMDDYPLPVVVAEDRERIAAVFAAAPGRTTGENVEFGCRHRDGDVRWMSLAWQPMYAAEGEYLGFRTSIRDVTERRKLRDQLRLHAEHLEQLVQERTEKLGQLERRQRQMEKLAALGQLAAGVAHEINNPLAGMRNAFELIRSTLTPEHEHYDLLELIDREIERISGIVHQMFQLYRRSPQQPTEFDLARIVREVVAVLESSAGRRGVAIRLTEPPQSPRVLLAEGEVKQILYNLVRNALEASSPETTVEVTIDPAEREIAVQVDDRGPGIAPDVLPQIFDPFFSTKQGAEQSGMGLGLSVSRSLIEAMGGRIEVRARGGGGSRFTAVFPLRMEAPQEPNRG